VFKKGNQHSLKRICVIIIRKQKIKRYIEERDKKNEEIKKLKEGNI
jgi:hypothetical protein